MTDPAAPPPFTPPPDWTTVDAAEWARQFLHHAKLDPRLPFDWGAMIGWFDRAILAGAAYAASDRAPRRFDPGDRDTWPDDVEDVLMSCRNISTEWAVRTFVLVGGVPTWVRGGGHPFEVEAGDLWLPLPPTPEVQG